MKFTYEGKEYALEFRRVHHRLHLPDKLERDVKRVITSKHPYTYARIILVNHAVPPRDQVMVYESPAVGVHVGVDRYSKEDGRLYALKALMPTVPVGMKPLIWAAYHERFAKP